MLGKEENFELDCRKKPTEHRQGKIIRFADAIQELINLQYDKNTIRIIGEGANCDFEYNKEWVEKISKILKELRLFDITEIGDLHYTCSGRVVLDRGYGEYFHSGDTVIFKRNEMFTGVDGKEFLKRIKKLIKE